MFGYVRPYRDELKMRDYDRFQAVYCGLCRTIGARCGFLPRLFLNYDFTFLALLLSASEPEGPCLRRRCIASPFRKKSCAAATRGSGIAADESVILLYWKLRDGAADEGLVRGLPSGFLSLLLLPAYRRAKKGSPAFDVCARTCLDALHTLERENSPSLDRAADTFANILAAAARDLPEPELSRPMEQLLYHVGRWIYLADAYHDRREDARRGAYNPLLARFSGSPELEREERDLLETTMTHSLNLAYGACALIDFGARTDLVHNILYLGMPAAQRLVLADLWDPKKWKRTLQR